MHARVCVLEWTCVCFCVCVRTQVCVCVCVFKMDDVIIKIKIKNQKNLTLSFFFLCAYDEPNVSTPRLFSFVEVIYDFDAVLM
jgi:hypothetical protein